MNLFVTLTKSAGLAGKDLCPLFLFLLTCTGFVFEARGQTYPLCGPLPPNSASSSDPNAIYYDRFGNSYDIPAQGSAAFGPQQTCVAGYFQLVTTGIPAALEPTICKVFEDLSNLVPQRNNTTACGDPAPPTMVRIEVTTGPSGDVLGTGTPYYTVVNGICGQVALSRVFQKINGSLVEPNSSIFDGKLEINSNPPAPWHTDWTTPPTADEVDLYSAVLHEAGHILGFASLLGLDGMSNSSGNFFSSWDQYLFTTTNFNPNGGSPNVNQLITSNCQSNCWTLNSTVFPNTNGFVAAVTNNCSAAGALDFVFGNPALAPLAGGAGVAPTTDDEMANMLSHLSPTCNGQNIDYVMQPKLGKGIPRRAFKPAEISILCQLGYRTTSCNGCYVAPNEEFPHPSENVSYFDACCTKDYYTCVGKTITIPHAELLCNDFTNSTTPLQISHFYLATSNNNNLTVMNSGGEFKITASAQGLYYIFYTVKGCDCKMANSVFTVLVGPCVSCNQDPCDNLSCANGFEDFEPISSNSFAVVYEMAGYWVHTGQIQNSPDICQESNGNRFVQMISREGLAFKLQQPIEPNSVATIKFRSSAGNVPNVLEIKGSQTKPCHPSDALINLGCVPTNCGAQNYSPICLQNVPINNTTTQSGVVCPASVNFAPYTVTWPNLTGAPINYLIFTVQEQGLKAIFLDDLQVTKTFVDACFTATVNCPAVTFAPCDPALNQTHSWDFGDQSSSTQPNPTHTYTQNGTFTVTHTVTDACGNVDTETKTVVISCIVSGFTCPCTVANSLNIDAGTPSADPSNPNVIPVSVFSTAIPASTISTFFSPNTLAKPCIAIKGNLIIDNNYDLMILGGEIRMQPGARIIIAPGATLRIGFVNSGTGTEQGIHGCNQMWRSIEVQPGGSLYTGYNVIQDGEFAFSLRSASGSTTNLTSYWNDFNRNHVGIRVNNTATATISQPFQFAKNQFRATSNLLPKFSNDITNWNIATPYAGLSLANTTFFVGTQGDAASDNEFNGLRNGILADRTTLNVYYARFLHTQGALDYSKNNPDFTNSQGIGIFARSCGTFNVRNSTFDDGARGIHTQRSNLDIRNSLLQNLDAGIYNVPALFNKINVYDNDIYYRGTAVVVDGASAFTQVTIDRNDPIQVLPSNISAGFGIWLINSPATTVSTKRVSFNQINLPLIHHYGIFVGASGDWDIYKNKVDFTDQHAFLIDIGIALSNADNNYLWENEIVSSGSSAAQNGFEGIALVDAENNTLCCNITDNLSRGIYFGGVSDDTKLRHSDIRDHVIGLDGGYPVFPGQPLPVAILGDQVLAGNAWNGSYDFLGAVHNGNENSVMESEFYVELPQSLPLWPNNPLSPALPGHWFIPNPTGGSSVTCTQDNTTCPALPPPPMSPEDPRHLTDNELAIVRHEYGGPGSFGLAAQFEGERSLYAKMSQYSWLLGQDGLADAFYTTANQGALDVLYQVDRRIVQSGYVSDQDWAQLTQLENDIAGLVEAINQIDGQYANAATASDSLSLKNQKIARISALQPLQDAWQNLADHLYQAQLTQITAAKTLNDGINYDDALVQNRKVVNGVYLETLASGNYTASESQLSDLLSVANQCYLEGGDAVLQARVLYGVLGHPLQIDDIALCSGSTDRDAKPEDKGPNTVDNLKIVPVPSKERISVQWNGVAPGEVLHIEIFDVNGKAVKDFYAHNGETLPWSFSPGLYFCRAAAGDQPARVARFIIIP